MKAKFRSLKEKYFDYSMIRWAMVGIGTTAIDYFIFIYIFTEINSVYIANLTAAVIATSINYFTHHHWTFKSEQEHKKSGVKYVLNLAFWWIISTSIIKILIVLGIDAKVAKLFPIIFIAPINYFVLNKIVFKKKR